MTSRILAAVIVPDANLLIYAVNSDSPLHDRGRAWWSSALNGDEVVGLPWHCLLAFVRISTHPGVFPRPLTTDDALSHVENWLSSPVARILHPSDRHPHVMRSLLHHARGRGDLVGDAHIAALALEFGGVVYSADADFGRFDTVRWVNPLVG